ncbi:hypothetical protein Tco_1439503 [Tanacetum coccineum]
MEVRKFSDHFVGQKLPNSQLRPEFGPSKHVEVVPSTTEERYKTSPEDLNVKFLRSLPSEWDTHVVVGMKKPDFETMGLDDFSSIGTNPINTVNTGVSTGTIKVNTAGTETSTASFSDATVYAFLSTQPQGSQLVHEDLEQIHDDDLEEMDLKWNMALLSMRARKFLSGNWKEMQGVLMYVVDLIGVIWQRMKFKQTWSYAFTDLSIKMLKTCSKSCQKDYEDLKKKYDDLLVKLDDTGFKAYTYKRGLSILEAQVVKYKESEVLFSEEIALLKRSVGHKDYLMGLVKTELEKVKEEKEGIEIKLAKFEKSSKDLDDLLASQVTDKSKRGFGYNAVPSPHPLILNRPTPLDLSYSGLEEFQQPEINWYGPRDSSSKPTTVCDRESNNSKENTDDPLTQQPKSVTETSSVVPTLKVDKKWKEKFFNHANNVRLEEPKKARENTDAPIIEDWVSDDEEEVESTPKVEKKIPTATNKESVNTVKPSRRTVRYAEMYRSQRPRGNQRSWNGQKTDQLGRNFVFTNKACFICGDFDHIQYYCPNAYKHMVPRAVLMKTGLKTVKNAKPVSTARCVKTVRPYHTAHPNSTVSCARPKSYFQNKAQLIVQRPFFKNTTLTNRSNNQNINTGRQTVNTVRPNVNTVRARGFNAVKPSACWVWRPIKPNGASLSNSQLNEKGFVDSGCSRHMSGNIAHLSDFKEFDGGYVTFGGGANGGRITGKGIQGSSESIISSQQDQDCIFMPIWKDASYFEDASLKSVDDAQLQDQDGTYDDCSFQDDGIDDHQVNTASPQVNTDTQEEDQGIDLGNLSPSYAVSSTPHTRIHKDHPIDHVIGDVQSSVQTRRMTTSYSELGFLSAIYEGKTHQDLHTCLFACFLSQEEPKRVSKALSDPAWVEAMQEELLQFKLQNVWVLVICIKGIGLLVIKSGLQNYKKDDEGNCCKDTKQDLLPKAIHMRKGIDYDEMSSSLDLPKKVLCERGTLLGFHQIIDFINRSHICYALTKKPEVCVSFIKQFWRTAAIVTEDNGNVKIHATVDGHSFSITEGSIRRHLKLDDQDGLISLPTSEIFAQLALMGYATNSDKSTSSPSPTPTSSPTPESTHTQPSPQPSPPQPSPTQPSPTHLGSEYHPPTPHDSPLHAVHSHGSDEGSLKLQELMNLINTLSDRVGVLEADLTKTKQTYNTEGVEDDSSKQGRKFSNEGFKDDEGVHEKASTETELFIQEVTPTEVIHEQEGSGKASDEISTAGKKKDTASEEVPPVSMLIDEEPKKKIQKEHRQERLSFAEAIRIEEQMHEEQRAQIARDAEIARQWEEEEKKRAMDEAEATKKIDWNDPSVLRYHSLKMKPKSIAQAERKMIKPIFEKLWDFNQKFVPLGAEKASKKQKTPEKERSPEKIMKEKVVTQEEKEEVPKEPTAKRKKSIPRGEQQGKRQKVRRRCEKDELKGFLDVVQEKNFPIEIEF